MKVRCKINSVHDVREEFVRKRLSKSIFIDDGEVDLLINKEYTVYGIDLTDGYPKYYLCTEEYEDYPKPFDLVFFDIVDERFSFYWKLSFSENEKYGCSTSIVFDEWAKDPMFYEELIDGVSERVQVFSRYRKLMDEEFLDLSQIEKEIQTGVIGKITQGECMGEFLKIFENKEQDQGYFLKKFSNPQHADSPGYDDWFESHEKLEKYFKLKGWKVKWSDE